MRGHHEQEIIMRTFTQFACTLLLVTFLSITSVFAQSSQMMVELSHDFTVGTRTLPAGKYSIARASSNDPGVFILQNSKTGARTFVVTIPTHSKQADQAASVGM